MSDCDGRCHSAEEWSRARPLPAPDSLSVAPASSQQSLRGILLFVTGLFCFASLDVSLKLMSSHYPVPMVAALRYFVNVALLLALLGPRHGRRLIRTQRSGWVMVRSLTLAGATLFMVLAFQRMPVAETTAMVFLSPLLVVLLAGRVLGEKVGVPEWLATVVGFAGILLIARPGANLDPMGVVYAMGAVVVLTGYQMLSRILAATESTLAMLFNGAVVGSVFFGLMLPWYWQGGLPPLEHVLLFSVAGAAATLGHFLFTAAYETTEASKLAPLMYVQLVWAGLLGWLVFDQVPDTLSLAGILLITAAGVSVGIRSRRTPREARAMLDTEP